MDIEIFPHRVLGSDTTEKLLNDLESLEDVKRTVIHGPRFPKGEATLPPKYRERRVININGEDVVLHPGSKASSRGEAKDSALLSSRDAGLLEPPERPQVL